MEKICFDCDHWRLVTTEHGQCKINPPGGPFAMPREPCEKVMALAPHQWPVTESRDTCSRYTVRRVEEHPQPQRHWVTRWIYEAE